MDLNRVRLYSVIWAVALLAVSNGVDAGCCCPSFWTAFGTNCYRLFSDNVTWAQAETRCQSYSTPSLGDGETTSNALGHLASIHSQEEQNFVYTFFESAMKKGTNSFLWLGLHDRPTDGVYMWTDGSPVDYTNWRAPNPTEENWEDCVVMMSREMGSNWNDIGCSPSVRVNYFLCKIPFAY